jgi:cellulose synthase/poly-beta-1,6-N-acetylglucosamine synthase-like glycosyltransferase/peptidoglycan/xylan/chitin deacetylase (PgdA/CDA1 family)/spore germination protein YaaH
MADKQVFQADTPGRWNRFKWLSRALIVVLISSLVAAVITIHSTQYPSLPNLNQPQKKFSKEDLEYIKHNRKFKDFKIDTERLVQLRHNLLLHRRKHPNNKDRINVGFYRAWETQAYTSLIDHISRMDMIVSEGFVITPKQDTVTLKLDTGLINLNRRYNKPVIISLTNYINVNNSTGYLDSKDVLRIVKSKKSRTTLINDIVAKLLKYNFQGVNLELDDIKDRNSTDYIAFEKELYETLHPQKFLVTQNVVGDDESFNLKLLQQYNDYLFVFAIDQHGENTSPGDISHQHWVEEILDRVCSQIPSNKVILTIAGGGYDWGENRPGTPMGYQQAISTAQENKSKIFYNPESANLHYTYTAQDSVKHTVYFTDAATNFNIIRMADDWATGGVALWRLGVEDPRLWSFFQKNLSIDSLRKTGIDTAGLARVGLNNHIDYAGDGEVLDLITVPEEGKINVELDPKTFTIANQVYKKLPTKYVIRKYGYKPGKVVLTFDDGPDPDFTPRILDILKREKVPAAFFVVGSMAEKAIPILKREYDEGYEIGNHTYFHPDISTVSIPRVKLELNATRKLIESVTGRSTILFRPPFNADAEPQTLAEVIPVAESRAQKYINIGESIDPWDWQPGVTADSIIARTIRDHTKGSMILLHDAGGDTREETVKALPAIIHYFKSHGYQFTTIADILDKKRDDLMPPIQDDANSGITGKLYDIFIGSYFYSNLILQYIFLTAIFLAIGRIVLIGVLAFRQYFDNKAEEKHMPDAATLGPVSIIVPGYNEEVTVIRTIESLLLTEYPVFEIIFVDDGSKDKTLQIVTEAYGNHPLVQVLTKPNGGKASALNFGITHAKYDHVICIDADTQLKTDAVYHLMRYFTDEEIGAVAGTVKVGNAHNLITNWQAIEYITAQNMDRRAFDLLNSITVVPGAIGAFKKSAIFKSGGFTTDTLAEDCDLTMRILKLGYIVRNCDDAIAYTEAPETLNALMKQRFRWSFGVIQSFWKNKDALFNKKYKFFGMVGMPNILLFQIVLPLFSPLADILMIFGLFSDKPFKIIAYYIVFIVIDLLVSMLAFWMEKESYKKLVYIIPQRFVWRQLMYWVLFKSVRRALKGELSSWGVLKRTGTVKMKPGASGK